MVRVPGPGKKEFAQLTRVEGRNGFNDPWPASALVAHLNDAFGFPGSGYHQLALMRIMAAWFLDVYVLASGTGKDGGRRMPMVGSGDGYGIHAGIIEDAAKVFDPLRFSLLLL